jgi:hypothetical protein
MSSRLFLAIAIATGSWGPPQLARGADQVRALTPDEVKKLVDGLGAASADVVGKVKKQLVELGPQAVAPVRAAAFTSNAEPVRRLASQIIEEIAKEAQKKLLIQLAKVKAQDAKVYRITDDALARVFPAHLVFAVRFPMYPVAVRPRAPLLARNLFIVDKEGQMDQVSDFKGINTFYTDNIRKVLTGKEVVNPARAWLVLAQELVQDGYFKFSIPGDAIRIGQAATGVRVIARAVIKEEKGNKGYLQVKLDFGLTGDLDTLAFEKEVTTGERPK